MNNYLEELIKVLGPAWEISISSQRITRGTGKTLCSKKPVIFCGFCGNIEIELVYGAEGHCNIGGGGEWEFFCTRCRKYTRFFWEWSD